jgi:hypothetical protein
MLATFSLVCRVLLYPFHQAFSQLDALLAAQVWILIDVANSVDDCTDIEADIDAISGRLLIVAASWFVLLVLVCRW